MFAEYATICYMRHTGTRGWGKVSGDGSEIWDSEPVFQGDRVTRRDRLTLLFYPKKFFLYRSIERAHVRHRRAAGPRALPRQSTFRVLDLGCGTGASVIDFKKLFGRSAEVVGVDVVRLQLDIAKKKMREHGVWTEVVWYDGTHLPFPDAHFDAVYTSDVLGHVKDVRPWLREINRVLKKGGTLAMFAESKLGRHAWIRTYLFDRGLNADPHAAFHISLYSKTTIREFLEAEGFVVKKMYSVLWAAFFAHPDEFYETLQAAAPRFPLLRALNRILYIFKRKLHPVSTAAAELYGLLEILAVGRWNESQGYIVLAEKDT